MRNAMIAMMAASIVAGLSTTSFAQRSLLRQYQGPVPQEAFNRCYHLALQQGINVSRGDEHIMDRFISACLNRILRR